MTSRKTLSRIMISCSVVAVLAGCDTSNLDFDMRGRMGGKVDTSAAAQRATAARPKPDSRGVISYPNYQVVVANRGDSVTDVANRVGVGPNELARYNGVDAKDRLRGGEVLALPRRVAEPSIATGAAPEQTDITSIASGAIESAPLTTPQPAAQPTAAPANNSSGIEPVRHRVERGETAYTIARLYNISVKSLAEWNGLGSDLAVREGQYLMIPVVLDTSDTPVSLPVSKPGQGSSTPTPPSAKTPLPADAKPATTTAAAAPKVAETPKMPTTSASSARMVFPVDGSIVREYAKGKNEGIDLSAGKGATVKAADSGKVAAITTDADQVPIVVIKHPNNILTVYANMANITVGKGDSVSRGQKIGTVGGSGTLHFEVRNGFNSVDPMPYLK